MGKIEKIGVLCGEVRPLDVAFASKINDLIDAVESVRNANPERKFMESQEGQEIGKKYQTFISEHTTTNPKIVEEIQKRSEQVWKEREISLVNHFQKAITGLQRIVTGEEKSKTEPDMRHDPEYLGCWVNVRILAQRALNELTLALSESGHDLKQMEEQI